MLISIINRETGNMTTYEGPQLAKMARALVAQKLTKNVLQSWHVTFHEGGTAQLVAQYRQPDGWCSTVTSAI